MQEPVRGYGLLQSPPDTSIWVPEISRPHLLPSLTPSDISFKLWSPPSSSIRVPLLSRSLCSSSRPLQVPPLGSFPYTLQTPPEPSFWALVMCRSLCSGLAPPCSSVCHLKDVQTLTLKRNLTSTDLFGYQMHSTSSSEGVRRNSSFQTIDLIFTNCVHQDVSGFAALKALYSCAIPQPESHRHFRRFKECVSQL